MMKDLIEFQRVRIEFLITKLKESEERTIELEDYIMDLCDKDCPNEYKNVVKSEMYKYYNDSK